VKTKILLADDEKTFQMTFTKVLLEEGFDVDAFDNGLDAIDAIKKTTYDIAILDIQMPGADGIKVLKEIMIRWKWPSRRSSSVPASMS
jgi:DNA-binding response OmpR family regulator